MKPPEPITVKIDIKQMAAIMSAIIDIKNEIALLKKESEKKMLKVEPEIYRS